MCSQVLDGLKMVFIAKNNANRFIKITCVLLYLSRALYIFKCINLSVQDLFLSELVCCSTYPKSYIYFSA
jgi:hypothetical protein